MPVIHTFGRLKNEDHSEFKGRLDLKKKKSFQRDWAIEHYREVNQDQSWKMTISFHREEATDNCGKGCYVVIGMEIWSGT